MERTISIEPRLLVLSAALGFGVFAVLLRFALTLGLR